MRIYAAADIHSKKERMERIEQVIDRVRPDLFVMAGDITNFFRREEALSAVNRICLPTFAVLGNSDFKSTGRKLDRENGKFLLGPKPLSFLGHEFIGISGTVPLPFLSKLGVREKKRLSEVKSHINRKTVFVVHPPPRKIRDKVGGRFHSGSIVLKNFVKTHPPAVLICGHIHEQPGFAVVSKTVVVNCAMNRTCSGALIDLYENRSPRVEMIRGISD